MITLFILLVILLALDLAVWKWGRDSRDGVDSSEWVRLHNWLGFH